MTDRGGVSRRDFLRLGHLPGAVSHPAYDKQESLEAFMAARWPVETASRMPVILYCYGRECIRSRDTATMLARMGAAEGVQGAAGLGALGRRPIR